MVEMKTYKGYDKDGKQVCIVQAVNATVVDIDPAEVQEALDNLDKVMEAAQEDLKEQAKTLQAKAAEAISVKGDSYETKINNITNDMCTGASNLSTNYEGLYDKAVKYHDDKQIEYNANARSTCRHQTGVVTVKSS